MELDIDHEVALMRRMTMGELKAKYTEVCRAPANSRNRDYLIRRIAWWLQANTYGGLSERALARARELANPADLRLTAPKPRSSAQHQVVLKMPQSDNRLPAAGTVITRSYKGQTFDVKVLAEGFEYRGQTYTSLSAVAKKITGQHCNGFLFFRLNKKGAQA